MYGVVVCDVGGYVVCMVGLYIEVVVKVVLVEVVVVLFFIVIDVFEMLCCYGLWEFWMFVDYLVVEVVVL